MCHPLAGGHTAARCIIADDEIHRWKQRSTNYGTNLKANASQTNTIAYLSLPFAAKIESEK